MVHKQRHSLRSLDLLPGSFRKHRRVRQVSGSWAIILMILTAVFVATLGESALNARRQAKRSTDLACTALPLRALRRDVINLQKTNQERTRWCALVETANPDDSALQAMAAIAMASQRTGREVLIDQLHLRFRVEPTPEVESIPLWSTPQLSIEARVTSAAAQQSWLDRLRQLDRITDLHFDGQASAGNAPVRLVQDGFLHLELAGTPLATRVVP